jgi:hypothetical protein
LDSSAGTFDHCFEHNLLTVSSIDPILLLLASKFCWDDVSAIGKCFHDRLAQRLSRVLNSRYKPILAKKLLGSRSPLLQLPPLSFRVAKKDLGKLQFYCKVIQQLWQEGLTGVHLLRIFLVTGFSRSGSG